MPAYILFLREDPIRDQAEMQTYMQVATQNPGKFNSTPLSMFKPIEALEGKAADGIVLVQFPNIEEAKAWYYSPGYQAAASHRKKAADYRVMIFEGL